MFPQPLIKYADIKIVEYVDILVIYYTKISEIGVLC